MKSKILLIAISIAFTTPHDVHAQDALAVGDATVHLRFENDRVRVLERTLQPGQREITHSHPPYVTYFVKGGKLRIHRADGKVTESESKDGDVVYSDAVTHWAENVGTTATQVIMVELKEGSNASPRP